MKLFGSFVLTLLAVSGGTVEDFYTRHKSGASRGLPAAPQMTKLSPYLSESLRAAIDGARAKQARCMKKHPDEKPPWIEGDLFSSNFEGFTSFAVGASAGGRVTVEFAYVERGQSFRWKDTVVVKNEGGRTVIDDVLYGRTEGFTSGFGRSLKASLIGERGCD